MWIPDQIIIHHSMTRDSETVSWPAIEHYHTHIRHWKDIGYHAGIEEVGGRLVCMYGRPLWIPGAHTRGQNSSSLGFCFVGCFDEFAPAERRLRMAARRVLAPWCIQFGIRIEDIYGHNFYADKSCPGRMFDVKLLREYVKEELRAAPRRP